MILVSICCWAGKQKQNIKVPSTPSLAFFNINATGDGLCWARKVTVCLILARLTRTNTLDILHNKINTLARPFPLHFSSDIRNSLFKIQVPRKPIVKKEIFLSEFRLIFFFIEAPTSPSPVFPRPWKPISLSTEAADHVEMAPFFFYF